MTSRYVGMASAMMLLAAAPPLFAQWLDPDHCITCPDKRIHFAAGVGLDLLTRGPWVAKSFHNRPWKRIAWTATVAASWEMVDALEARREGKAGRRGYGFGPFDLAATVAGAVFVEGVQALTHKLRRRRPNQPHS